MLGGRGVSGYGVAASMRGGGSDPEEYFFPVQEIAESPFQHEYADGGDDRPDRDGDVCECHQSVGDGGYIFVKPTAAHYFKKEIDKYRVHTDDEEEFQVFAMVADIDPPIAKGEDKEGPAKRYKDK